LKVDGMVYGLSYSGGKLFASTAKGEIYCFSANGKAKVVKAPKVSTAISSSAVASYAKKIVAQGKLSRGFAVDIDCIDPALVYELAEQSELYVIGFVDSAAQADTFRRQLDDAGVYGSRVTILQKDKGQMHLPKYFATLVVSSKSMITGSLQYDKKQVAHIQRPYNGIVCFGKPGTVKTVKRGALAGAGEWTHPLGDEGNSLSSGDSVVKGPLKLLWYEDEELIRIDRHGKNPAPLFYNGVTFRMGRDAIKAIDTYNGAILWEVEIPGVLAGMTGGTGVGGNASGNMYCAGNDTLYVSYKNRCERFDIYTGKRLKPFVAPKRKDGKAPTWQHVSISGDYLVGAIANEEHIVVCQHGNGGPDTQVPMEKMFTEAQTIFVMDADSGKLKWRYDAKESIRYNSVSVGNGKIYFVDQKLALVDTILRTEALKRRRGIAAGKEKQYARDDGTLFAMNLKDGAVAWKCGNKVLGTTTQYSIENDILILGFNTVGRAQNSDQIWSGGSALNGSTGEVLWKSRVSIGRQAMIGGYLRDYKSYDMKTGQSVYIGLQDGRNSAKGNDRIKAAGIGCGVWVGGDNIMLRRSGTLAYYDLNQDSGWMSNYGGLRTGCWINAIPVGGVVMVPDDTQGCRCSYQNVANIAMIESQVRLPEITPTQGSKFKISKQVSREVVFTDTMTLQITTTNPELELRYTTDKTYPTNKSPLYTGAFEINDTTWVSAALFKDGIKVSQCDKTVFLKVNDKVYSDFDLLYLGEQAAKNAKNKAAKKKNGKKRH